MNSFYILRISIVCIALIILTIIKNVHIIQLNSYNIDQEIIWLKKNLKSFLINIVLLIAVVLYYKLSFIPAYIVVVVSLLGILIENLPRKQKKKLVYTARIRRLIFISLVLFFLFFLALIIKKDVKSTFYPLLAVAFAPLIVNVAFFISLPIENAFRKKFMNEAKGIIDKNDSLYTIGITGSFGKTSVKHYLYTLLSAKYSTCMTPESYNTAMGATLTIKNNLKNIDEIFICEMGARRVGDVKEICDIVSPKGAILTDVGKMHLDTFLNIKNVRKCKFELIDSVYNSHIKNKESNNCITNKNVVLVNGDNALITEKIKEYDFSAGNLFTYGLMTTNDFYATNINASSSGTTFTMVCYASDEAKKEEVAIETKLLGLYNIKNLVAAISYAMLLNVDISDIKMEVKKIEAVSHRLKLITYDKNNLLIDDAYNSNPLGAKNAIDTIEGFIDYKKIVITPGMVELGDVQEKENMDFGSYMGDRVDFALIVGKTNKDALLMGLKGHLLDDNIICFDKVEEAIFYARNNIEGKKVILLENDLSDNY